MPLEVYKRKGKWWVRGTIEYGGTAISGYYRKSTRASEEAGAWEWCREEEKRVLNRHLNGETAGEEQLGPKAPDLTFADAVLKYTAKPKEATYLIPILTEIGAIQIRNLKPSLVRKLGEKIYPMASTATWTRQIITPVRAVVNNLYDDSDGTVYRIRGYTKAEKVAQDKKRGSRLGLAASIPRTCPTKNRNSCVDDVRDRRADFTNNFNASTQACGCC